MTVVRKNFVTDEEAKAGYISGVWRLKREITDGDGLSTYDRYVLWHLEAMHAETPQGHPGQRNAAHSGPVFLPWHRMYLRRFERELQRVLEDDTFGLPYWNWAIDGQLPPDRQPKAPIWDADAMGPSGKPVSEGPFRFDQSNIEDPGNWRIKVLLTDESSIRLDGNRGLERTIGRRVTTLPKVEDVNGALALANYDTSPWSRVSTGSFRNSLEGWSPREPLLHNRVHVWVGGDMGWGHSPNDPVFFVHHANVDRIWAYWQSRPTSGPYVPDQNTSQDLFRHRIDDPLFPMKSTDPDVTPKDMSALPRDYAYDTYDDMEAT